MGAADEWERESRELVLEWASPRRRGGYAGAVSTVVSFSLPSLLFK